MVSAKEAAWIRVGRREDLREGNIVVVLGADRPVAVFAHEGKITAVDNRCPHLGFPLHKGIVKDGILTCPWHQARFDLCSGCTFDLWADDVPSYETKEEQGEVFVAALPRLRPDADYYFRRLRKGMDQNVTLLQAKGLIGLLKSGVGPVEILRDQVRNVGLSQNTTQGIVELAINANLREVLTPETSYFTLLRASVPLAAASRNSKRQMREPLEGRTYDFETLKRWFRQWIQGRDVEGAERVLLTAVNQGATPAQLAELLFEAHADRIFSDGGHHFDLSNKVFELLDAVGWNHAADLLPLVPIGLAASRGTEENATWHHPIEVVEPLRAAEAELPKLLREARGKSWRDGEKLTATLLGDDPMAIVAGIRNALAEGAPPPEVSKRVAYAAAWRLARFAKANEVGDWFNPQHTFIYANAVHQTVRRTQSPAVLRAVFHAALSVYMDRFLNVPPAKLPSEVPTSNLDALPTDAPALRARLLDALNEQGNLEEAARIVTRFVRLRLPIPALFDALAYATAREDLDFHTFQVLDAAYRQCLEWKDQPEVEHILVGVAKNLAAVCPTPRQRLKVAVTAMRLHHGDKIYEEEEESVA